MTLSKRDLLNQMVSQTKQHRQQIRSVLGDHLWSMVSAGGLLVV